MELRGRGSVAAAAVGWRGEESHESTMVELLKLSERRGIAGIYFIPMHGLKTLIHLALQSWGHGEIFKASPAAFSVLDNSVC